MASGGVPLTVSRLERWTEFGAGWRVRSLSASEVVLDLCTCTGELVERAGSRDTEVIAYVRSAGSAERGRESQLGETG
jgi:hypothetical protein